MSERFEAHHEHRTYYFYIVSKEPEELKITMYNTPYTFIKQDHHWVNHPGNAMNMVEALIYAVILAAGY
ncbi:hypothetical protein D0C36_22730 [Mucilaginibacter conchicola]|uniref:Uncharacterized protein n=1 Tax=Mucilaginibacter conchicola TaxID=2303333 RepID=A0A372NM94_9SPHI|nr:hypothetical protein [Mucilaginibacter conchicola]RFZ90061.1 hypothetical protein D0C36_22730 [Mucilaginibacter conchicola]